MKSVAGVKTSTILIAGAAGVAVFLLVPKIRSHTGFATNVNRGRPAVFPGQGGVFPGQGNAYAYGHNKQQPRRPLPPQARGRRF